MDERGLKCSGNLERMDEYHMVIGVLMAKISGGHVPGRPKLGRMDCVMKVALGSKGVTVEAGRECVKYRNKWGALVHM